MRTSIADLKHFIQLAFFVCSIGAAAALIGIERSHAQVCFDADADEALAGAECPNATDCADRSWSIRPGAEEICDGLDQDCDGLPDNGCAPFCNTLVARLRQDPSALDFSLPAGLGSHAMALTEHGLIVASPRRDDSAGGTSDEWLIYSRAFDRDGRIRDIERWTSERDADARRESAPGIAAAGDRVFVTWQDRASYPEHSGYIQRGRVLDATGRPISPEIDLSAPVGQPPRFNKAATLWDGERFVAFWFAYSPGQQMYMSIVDADGVPADPVTRLVTDDADGRGHSIQRSEAVWTGEKYLVILGTDAPDGVDDIVIRSVNHDGTPGATTVLPGRALLEDAVITNDRVVLLLTWRNGLTDDEAWLAFLDLDGNLVDPGIPWIGSFAGDGISASRLAWSGDIFGVAVTDLRSGPFRFYKWWFVRVGADGVPLEEPYLMIDNKTVGEVGELLWNGRDFWLLGSRRFGGLEAKWETYLHTIACSCFDDDGDNYDACFDEDCDDTDPTAYPGAREVCRGDRDEDCDGLIDCDDTADCPSAQGPQGIRDLEWNATGLRWSAPAAAESFDLARGLWSDVLRRDDYLIAECAAAELATPAWTDDGRRPPAGDLLWYLIRTEAAPCARSDWGPTNRERTIKICR